MLHSSVRVHPRPAQGLDEYYGRGISPASCGRRSRVLISRVDSAVRSSSCRWLPAGAARWPPPQSRGRRAINDRSIVITITLTLIIITIIIPATAPACFVAELQPPRPSLHPLITSPRPSVCAFEVRSLCSAPLRLAGRSAAPEAVHCCACKSGPSTRRSYVFCSVVCMCILDGRAAF
jgi:hypothetical protein